jgi:4-hydroxy-3-polyprenylbenzoate decarboxylase
MKMVTLMGGIIIPPVPGFYAKPASLDDLVNHTVGKILDQWRIDHDLFKRWGK